jgi:ankyrin repeat protein
MRVQASLAGRLEVVRVLLQAGADVNLQNEFGGTALIMACGSGRTAIVRELLLHNPSADLRLDEVCCA